MGVHGSKAMAAEVAKRGKGQGGLNVLTHCNTGSLATAGFGTALGVVRALHSQGKLQHVYCTETRPYNQGESPGRGVASVNGSGCLIPVSIGRSSDVSFIYANCCKNKRKKYPCR